MDASMSMMWMPMPGQSWPGAAVSFLGMWVVMMAAMMLPVLIPMLWRYREAVTTTGATRLGGLTAVVTIGYFFVWAMLGLVVFVLGAQLMTLEMQRPALARAAPILAGVVVLASGVLQFTAWKARRLACCRETPICDCVFPANVVTAWRYGLRIGLNCSYCCAGLTAALLAIGVMDLGAMAVVTAAIWLERLSPAGKRMARAIGAVAVATGILMTVGTIPANS
jgi:predicted metal-binding membrane protein